MPYRDLQRDIIEMQRLELRHHIASMERELGLGMCSHLNAVPVEVWTGEVVAQLCLSCDAQLPPKRKA